MFEDTQSREERGVRIDTLDGPVEGFLRISPKLRTLDDLNLVARRFITLHSHNGTPSPWNFGPESLSISKSSVLFVRELRIPQKGSSNQFGNFSRAAVKLRVKEFDIEGFVHVPPGGAAMKRLDHSDHPFVSLTTVLLTGPEGETMVPFLAVNLEHIGAVQEAAVSAV